MLYGIYGILWGKSDNVNKIAKLQKKAIRTISFSRPIAHTEPLFKRFNLLKCNDINTLKLRHFFYKLSNDSLPAYFASYKTLIRPLTTRYPLRKPITITITITNNLFRHMVQ